MVNSDGAILKGIDVKMFNEDKSAIDILDKLHTMNLVLFDMYDRAGDNGEYCYRMM